MRLTFPIVLAAQALIAVASIVAGVLAGDACFAPMAASCANISTIGPCGVSCSLITLAVIVAVNLTALPLWFALEDQR